MKIQPIIIIFLVGIVIFLLMKPKPVDNPYYLRKMEESLLRESIIKDSLNNLIIKKYEIKESIARIDTVYTDISKDSLRARIRHSMSTRFNR